MRIASKKKTDKRQTKTIFPPRYQGINQERERERERKREKGKEPPHSTVLPDHPLISKT
jgi:hypothetical protein